MFVGVITILSQTYFLKSFIEFQTLESSLIQCHHHLWLHYPLAALLEIHILKCEICRSKYNFSQNTTTDIKVLWVFWTGCTHLLILLYFWNVKMRYRMLPECTHASPFFWASLRFALDAGMWVEMTGAPSGLGISEKPKLESLVLSSPATETFKIHLSYMGFLQERSRSLVQLYLM